MKERPILFTGAMVRALLDGSKTQTRRVVKPQPLAAEFGMCRLVDSQGRPIACPYGQPGDRLWVRETFALSVVDPDGGSPQDEPDNWDVFYRADPEQPGGGWTDAEGNEIAAPWKPSIHMPRWACRILLEITRVRVERLQDISYEDARAEGVDLAVWAGIAINGYKALWESINGAGSWDANPWVWVVEFKRVTP
jgi:hypothetical protein